MDLHRWEVNKVIISNSFFQQIIRLKQSSVDLIIKSGSSKLYNTHQAYSIILLCKVYFVIYENKEIILMCLIIKYKMKLMEF